MKKKIGLDSFAHGYSLGIKFVFILACPIISGAACGIWLDKLLNTVPCIMLLFLILGLAFSVYAVYRVASQLQEKGN